MQIIDQIKSALVPGAVKTIAINEAGRFGLARIENREAAGFTSAPATLGAVVAAARAVISGEPRAVTAPGVTQGLAIGVLATAWRLGQVAEGIDTLIEENRRLRALCGEAKDVLAPVDGQEALCRRLGDAMREGA